MSNKMALDALTAAVQLCEWIAETPHQRGSINGKAAQVLYAASEAIAALQAEPQPEPVAQIVGTGGTANMPLLQWLSADHSFRAPIGSMLYALPAAPPKD